MRFRHPDGSVVHLSYGSNVHPAETVDGIVDQLRRYAGAVRSALDADVLGVGLWLPASVAAELAGDRAALDRLRRALRADAPRGRHRQRLPLPRLPRPGRQEGRLPPRLDRARPPRLHPRLRARAGRAAARRRRARQHLHAPAGLAHSLGRRPRPRRPRAARAAGRRASRRSPPTPAARCGSGFEPEPGCVVETVADAVERLAWLRELDSDLLGVCVDTCHLATGFEDDRRGARPAWPRPGSPSSRPRPRPRCTPISPADDATRSALTGYAEGRFLHQTREQDGSRVTGRDDLDEALGRPDSRRSPGRDPWRVHFHVPVHADPEPPLTSTRPTSRPRSPRWSAATTPGHRPRRGRDLHLGRAAPAAATRTTTPAWSPASPPRSRWVRDRFVELGLEPRKEPRHEPPEHERPLLVVDVVGLTPDLLEPHAARAARGGVRLRRRAGHGAAGRHLLGAVDLPHRADCRREHGIVGNGWYFRDLGEVFLWRQHNALVQGEKLWDVVRRAAPGLQGRQRVLVVRHGRRRRQHRDAAAGLPRRRPQVPRLLDLAARAARPAHRRARRRSRCSPTGARPRRSPARAGSSTPPAS